MVIVLALFGLVHLSWRWMLWPAYLGNYMRVFFPAAWGNCISKLDNLPLRGNNLPFGHLWSLCVEEQFYLVWPPIVFLVKDRVRLRNGCLLVAALLPFCRLAAEFLLPQGLMQTDFLYRATPFRVDALLLGGALALMLRGPEAAWIFRVARPLLACLAIVFPLTWWFAVRVLHQSSSGMPCTPWVATFGFTLIDLAAAAILLLSLHPGTWVYRGLMNAPLRRLGQISYGFYVFHDLPHGFLIPLVEQKFGELTLHTDFVITLLGFISTVTLAWLSFRFFETPFLRLKDKWAA